MAKKAEPQVKYTAVCVNCGIFIPEDRGLVRENRHYCETCAVLAPAVKPALIAPSGILKILCYLVSLMPLAGFVFGAVFYPQPDAQAKNFGKMCFLMMLAGIGLMLFFFFLAALTGAALGGTTAGFNIGEGYY